MPDIIAPPIHTRHDGTISREIYSLDGNKKYRYLLERIWNLDLPVLMFVMSHASRATVVDNNGDRAVSTCENRARNHHTDFNRNQPFGGVCVTNIFAFMQTEQNPLLGEANPVHTENYDIIEEYARRQNVVVVCAWGNKCNHPLFLEQAEIIKNILSRTDAPLNYFGLTRDERQPKHVNRHDSTRDFMEWIRPL